MKSTIRSTSIDAAHSVLAKQGTSFWLASLFLPRRVADDSAIIYQFCRLVDDMVDEAKSPAAAHENVRQLRLQFHRQLPADTAIDSFLSVCDRLQIPEQLAETLIQGVAGDQGKVRVPNRASLGLYAYRVAGVVGRMMCGALEVTDQKAWQPAIELGIAMQLTNICRDVLEDAEKDRVYLPADMLQTHNVTAESIINGNAESESVANVVLDILEMADVLYERARAGMHFIPFRMRISILIASRVYQAIGHKLRDKHHGNPLHGKTVVSFAGKLWNVFRGLADALSPVTLGLVAGKTSPSPFKGNWHSEEPASHLSSYPKLVVDNWSIT